MKLKLYLLKMKDKRAELWHQMIMHIIIVGLIFLVFLMFTAGRVDSRDVKQQVLEKQLALLIDSAPLGTILELRKISRNGLIQSIFLEKGKIFVYVSGLEVSKGYPYYSEGSVFVREDGEKFYVEVK
jgi:hypothetical protein